jgi:hypothetical protein
MINKTMKSLMAVAAFELAIGTTAHARLLWTLDDRSECLD